MKLVPKHHIFKIPTSLAVCPYCNPKLYASCEAWTENDEGEWLADSITVDCETEPDIDSDEWREWFDSHSDMPYVYQLPVNVKIENWINSNFRFLDD